MNLAEIETFLMIVKTKKHYKDSGKSVPVPAHREPQAEIPGG